MPDYSLEASMEGTVCGIDEVGRGPLAGPVVAAAVILHPHRIPEGLDDSKRLSAKRRGALLSDILATAQIGIGIASVAEIDRLNILRAAHIAMERAVAALPLTPRHALVDGRYVPSGLPCRGYAVVRGDQRSVSIAAASIVAKERRDAIMVDLAQQHPGYGWERNKGYPSKSHRAALHIHGISPHHRRSFRPVHNILYQDNF